MKSLKTGLTTALIGLIFGLAGGTASSLYVFDQLVTELGEDGIAKLNYEVEETAYTEAWAKAAPAVVSIVALKDLSEYYNQFFGNNGFSANIGELTEVSNGTAFIITPDGLAVTNKHVVDDDTAEYVVILDDGTELYAEVLDKDTLNDIAIIQLSGDDEIIGSLPTLEFADSDQLQVGEPVLAIGNALGEYANTTTAGIVSATGRQIIAAGAYGENQSSLVNLIQTDAAINPGNSGGPLVNLNGEVVGMNSAVDTTAEGIGFAIPSNEIATVVTSYQEYGRIVRPFLGVRYILINAFLQNRFSLTVDYGAYVYEDRRAGLDAVIEGGPADEAGIQAGDIILSLEGQDISENFDLSNAIAAYSVGDTVQLEVLRTDKTIKIEVTLGENTD